MNASKPLLIRNFSFFKLWLGQLLSQSCARMYQIALMWWILSQAGQSAGKEAALFLILGALPSILLAGRIGHTVDRHAAKSILVLADTLATVTVLSVAALLQTHLFNLSLLYLSGFFLALFQAYYDPTLNKAVPDLVEADDIESAVALMSSTQSIANFGGAVLGAALIESVGATGIACLNALGYGAALLCNLSISFRTASVQASETVLPKESIWTLLSNAPWLRKALIGFGFVNFFSTPILVVLPLYVKKTLMAGASTLGILEAALWIGLVLGSLLSERFRFTSNPIELGAYCLFSMGLALTLPSFWVQTSACGVSLFFVGFFLGVNNVKFISLFQEVVPSEIKGRFFASMQALVSFTIPVAYFIFGAAADWTGPTLLCLIQGIGIATIALYFLHLSKQLTSEGNAP